MTEYSRIAKGSFTSTGNKQIINLPFAPDRIELTNYTAAAAFTDHGIPFAKWDVMMGQGTAVVEYVNSGPVLTTAVVKSNGFSIFGPSMVLGTGPSQQVIGITAANPPVVNVTNHGYSVGDTVSFTGLYQTSTTGMPQLCWPEFTITEIVDANHFEIQWDASGSNYTAISGSPAGALVTPAAGVFDYVPTVSTTIAFITLGPTTTVVTTHYHNFVVGQEIAFRIPEAWGTTQLNSLPNNNIPGSPQYAYVTSVVDNWTFVCNVNSTGFTPFNPNQPVASIPGMTFPEVVPVGDVNTGGNIITATSPLYPSPQFPTFSNGVPTINGPAIRGAFVNNTSQGFIIGTGNAVYQSTADTSSHLVGANADVIYWAAYLDDITMP